MLPPPHHVSLITLDALHAPDYASLPVSTLRANGGTAGVLATLKEGEGYEARHSIRLPNGELLRPSTEAGSITPFRVKHELCIEVMFQPIGSTAKILKMRRPLTVPSVSCFPLFTKGESDHHS